VRDVGESYPIKIIGSLEVESIESYVQPQVKIIVAMKPSSSGFFWGGE